MKTQRKRPITSAKDITTILGGVQATARRLGTSDNTVYNWHRPGRGIPMFYWVAVAGACSEAGRPDVTEDLLRDIHPSTPRLRIPAGAA